MDKLLFMHDTIRDLIGKYRGGSFSPERIDRAINYAQLELYDRETAKFAADKHNLRKLRPMMNILEPPTTQYHPVGDELPIRVEGKESGQRYEEVKPNEIEWVLDDSIGGPTPEFPVWVLEGGTVGGKIATYPLDYRKSVRIYTVRPPRPVEYVYGEVNLLPTYNAQRSKQPEWDQSVLPELIAIALGQLGVSINHQEVVQYSTYKDQKAEQV